jgi:hypothetical protein
MIFGIPFNLITAVAVYMVATVITTEYLKKVLYIVDVKNNRHSVMLSWLVGMFFYVLMYVLEVQEVTFHSFLLYIVITGFLNTGYRFTSLKRWIRKLMNGNGKK